MNMPSTNEKLPQQVVDSIPLSHKDAIKQLRFNEALLGSMPIPVFYKDVEGRYLGCNEAFIQVLGITKEEIVGKKVFEIWPGDDAKKFHEQDMDLMANPTLQTYEHTVRTSRGESITVIFSKNVFLDDKGQLAGIVGSFIDITARKDAEEKIRQSKQEWETTFDAMSEIITIQDKNMRITRANKSAHKFFQIMNSELIGRYCYEIFRNASSPCQNCPGLTALKDHKNHCEIIRHDKLGKIFHVSSAPILDENGELKYLVHSAKDITQQKKLEEEIFQAHKMEAIGTLAGGIAHDFNNILAVILGYADIAKDDLPPDSIVVESLDRISIAGVRAKDLVAQILAFSRKNEEELIPIKPEPIIKEALKLLRASIPSTIEFFVNIIPNTGVILADHTQIHQILMNLCTNAYHAMEEKGGKLTVELKNTFFELDDTRKPQQLDVGKYVELVVSDTGSGISPAIIKNIFDPYFTTKKSGKGTGMGLSIVHGIITGCGGAIAVNSQLGTGTTFHVYFPVFDKEKVVAESLISKDIPKGKERILFVDDEDMIADMGKNMLERIGYKVTVRKSSLEALQKFQNQPDQFDLVITDQTMPEMTGSDLAKRMMQIRPDIPIILCTGYSTIISEEKAKAMGIKEFALKPLVIQDIAKLIRKVLDAS